MQTYRVRVAREISVILADWITVQAEHPEIARQQAADLAEGVLTSLTQAQPGSLETVAVTVGRVEEA